MDIVNTTIASIVHACIIIFDRNIAFSLEVQN